MLSDADDKSTKQLHINQPFFASQHLDSKRVPVVVACGT